MSNIYVIYIYLNITLITFYWNDVFYSTDCSNLRFLVTVSRTLYLQNKWRTLMIRCYLNKLLKRDCETISCLRILYDWDLWNVVRD